jgi:hypothetical protein
MCGCIGEGGSSNSNAAGVEWVCLWVRAGQKAAAGCKRMFDNAVQLLCCCPASSRSVAEW